MRLHASVTVSSKNPYEFSRVVKRLVQCKVENLRANSIDNYINFEVRDINLLFECLDEFKGIFLTVDLKIFINTPEEKLHKFLTSFNVRRTYTLYPYKIIAVVDGKDYQLILQRTSNRNTYIIRCVKAKNVDIVLPPSAFLFIGSIDSIKNEINKCIETLNKVLPPNIEKDLR